MGRKVAVGAVDPFAWELVVKVVALIKAAQPPGAYIGGKRPLADPGFVLNVLEFVTEERVAKSAAVRGDVVVAWLSPSQVSVVVKDSVLNVVVGEEIVPDACKGSE